MFGDYLSWVPDVFYALEELVLELEVIIIEMALDYL